MAELYLEFKSQMDTYEQINNIMIHITPDYVRSFLETFIVKFSYKFIDLDMLVDKIVKGLPAEVTLNTFYNFAADQTVVYSSQDPEYNHLASNILVDRLHKATFESFTKVNEILYNNVDMKGQPFRILSDYYYGLVKKHGSYLETIMKSNDDYQFDYFGIRTLERSYLLRIRKYSRKWRKVTSEDVIVERPIHLFMRTALFIHGDDLEKVEETYKLFIERKFTHATPTLFNAGTKHPQLSSCYLIAMEDNIDSISDTFGDIMKISKWAGGIGVHVSSIRSEGSLIRGTNGISDGIVPVCRGLNWVSCYVNQGGKRKGSIAVYMEPYHSDMIDFIELRKNTGSEDRRCRDLFLALWIPDLFMQRVMDDQLWSLMCPDECSRLNLLYGKDFDKLYTKYESEGRYVTQIKARELWKEILISQSETGFPYILYKDSANRKSNQKNLGTIRSSNLCAEIIEYSDSNETAVCNLVSICLPQFIKDGVFNFEELIKVARVSVNNLNKVIDLNFYPTEKTKFSNMKHRPVGLGIQGLSDIFCKLKLEWGSPEALKLDKKILEHIYYGALLETIDLAKKDGCYQSFQNSDFSIGKLQFHHWNVKVNDLSPELNWTQLIEDLKVYGARNSLLTALMPTASTSQIMGNYECFEPYRKMMFVRTTLAGEFIVINDHLIKDLKELKLWNEDLRKLIIIDNGSIQNIPQIPDNLKKIYRTAFEIPLKTIIDHSVARAPFVDQSQSLNLFINKPDFTALTSAHFYGWKKGLKTGMYYLHTNPAVNPINFGIDINDVKRLKGISSLKELVDLHMDNSSNKVNDETKRINGGVNGGTNGEEPPVKTCKFTPGKRAEGCEMCSS
jgi:ribonucleoside-diphosphate reductase alpha subunit